MRKTLIFIIVTLPLVLKSQSRLDTLRGWTFNISPSALVNIYPGIQVGIESGIKSIGYLEFEGAYLIPVQNTANSKRSGVRFKLGYKIPHSKKWSTNLILFYRHTFHDRRENFSRFDGLFQEYIEFKKSKRLIGPSLGFSGTSSVNKNSYTEYGFSVGMGQYKVVNQDVPSDAKQRSGIRLFRIYEDPGTYWFPILSIQVKYKFGL